MTTDTLTRSGTARSPVREEGVRISGFGGILLAAALGAAVAVGVLQFLKPAPPGPGAGGGRASVRAVGTSNDAIGESRRTAIVRAAEAVGPGVVSITAIERRIVNVAPYPPGFDDMFGGFFGGIPGYQQEQQVPSYGSGFLFDGDGHILTNSHVVHGADVIQVSTSDGRQFKGRVLGEDPDYDLAVIRIDAEKLQPVTLGDSDDLLIGEWAIAVGNPFGYLLGDTHPTVTVGVVSAKNRDIKTNVSDGGIYKNMIQTDASINPGNSGGPLVNSRGEVIGINTFIFTQGGGSLGIGFAIPMNTAAEVAREIIQYGRVRGYWLGLEITDLTPLLAYRLNTEDRAGVVVARLERGSPAARAGIELGDIIRGINGNRVTSSQDTRRVMFGSRAGDEVGFTIERQGRRRDYRVTLGEPSRKY